jgi:hypothetical protein
VSTKSICAGWESIYSSGKVFPKLKPTVQKPPFLKINIVEEHNKAVGFETL